jgi:hypothetical protein
LSSSQPDKSSKTPKTGNFSTAPSLQHYHRKCPAFVGVKLGKLLVAGKNGKRGDFEQDGCADKKVWRTLRKRGLG